MASTPVPKRQPDSATEPEPELVTSRPHWWRQGLALALDQFDHWATDKPLITVLLTALAALALLTSRMFLVTVFLAGGLVLGYMLAQDGSPNWGQLVEGSGGKTGPRLTKRAAHLRRLLARADHQVTQRSASAAAMGRLESESILAPATGFQSRGRASAGTAANALSHFPPELQRAWGRLAELILRDFVDFWYKPLEGSGNGELRSQVHQLLTTLLLNVHEHMRQDRVNLSVLIFYAMSNTLIVHLREYRQLALSQKPVAQYLADNPTSSFHQLASHDAQVKYLMDIAKFLLTRLLPAKDRNSPAVFAFLTEILATNILEPTVASVCDPDRINLMIVDYFGDASHSHVHTPPSSNSTVGSVGPSNETAPKNSVASRPTLGAALWQKLGSAFTLDSRTSANANSTSTLAVCINRFQFTDPVEAFSGEYQVRVSCTDPAAFPPQSTPLSQPDATQQMIQWNEALSISLPTTALHSNHGLVCTLTGHPLSAPARTLGSVEIRLPDIVHDDSVDSQCYIFQLPDGNITGKLFLSVYVEPDYDEKASLYDSDSDLPAGYQPLDSNEISPIDATFLSSDNYKTLSPLSATAPSQGSSTGTAVPGSIFRNEVPAPEDVNLDRLFPLSLAQVLDQSDGFVEFMQYLEDRKVPPYLRLVMNVDSYQRFARTLNDPHLMRDDAWSIFHLHFEAPPAEPSPGSTPRTNPGTADHPPYRIPIDTQYVVKLMDTIRNHPSPDCFQPILEVVHDELVPYFNQFKEESPLYHVWLDEKWGKFVRSCRKKSLDPQETARSRLADMGPPADKPIPKSSESASTTIAPASAPVTPVPIADHSPSPLPDTPDPHSPMVSELPQSSSLTPSPTDANPPTKTPSPNGQSPSPTSGSIPASPLSIQTSPDVISSNDSYPSPTLAPQSASTVTRQEERLVFLKSAIAQVKEQISIIDDQTEELARSQLSGAKQRQRQLAKSRAALVGDLDQLLVMAEDTQIGEPNGGPSSSPYLGPLTGSPTLAARKSSVSAGGLDDMDITLGDQLLSLNNVTVHVEEEADPDASRGAARMAVQLVSSLGTRDSALIFIVECEQEADATEGTTQRGWMITRSYADFSSLHSALKQLFTKVDKIKFPSRQWSANAMILGSGTRSRQSPLANGLQVYLSLLLSDRILCASRPLQLFMKPDHMTVPKSFFSGNPVAFLNPARGHTSPLMGGSNMGLKSQKSQGKMSDRLASPGPHPGTSNHGSGSGNNALYDVLSPKFITEPAAQAANATSRTVNAAFKSASSAIKRLTSDTLVGSPTPPSSHVANGSSSSLPLEPSIPARRSGSLSSGSTLSLPSEPIAESVAVARNTNNGPQRSFSASHTLFTKPSAPSGISLLNQKLTVAESPTPSPTSVGHSNTNGGASQGVLTTHPTGPDASYPSGGDATAVSASSPNSLSSQPDRRSQLSSQTVFEPESPAYTPFDKPLPPKPITPTHPTAPAPLSEKPPKTPTSNGSNKTPKAVAPTTTQPSVPATATQTKSLQPEEIELLIETCFALLDEVFDLNDTKQWFRRKALAVLKQLLRQSYASTISGSFVDLVTKYTDATTVAEELTKLTDSLWPNGVWYTGTVAEGRTPPATPTTAQAVLGERTEEQKEATKLEARVLFVNRMPDALQRMVGDYNGVMGMTRLFELLQHPELMRPIVIKLMDNVFKLAFSDMRE
ncbi:phosphatidylinositol binding [Dimargaris cristalligena]|nr:phosphatidylinositol binding [Dimargaris cristalligena]